MLKEQNFKEVMYVYFIFRKMSDAEEDKNWKEKWAEESEKVKALETISKDG